jgi:hypothetical protein
MCAPSTVVALCVGDRAGLQRQLKKSGVFAMTFWPDEEGFRTKMCDGIKARFPQCVTYIQNEKVATIEALSLSGKK